MNADLLALAEAVDGEDFYDIEDGRRNRVRIDWPWTLVSQVHSFLSGPQSAADRNALVNIAKRVDGRDWCTLWQDPGDDSAPYGRMPDVVSPDERPNDLAQAVLAFVEELEDAEVGA